MKITKRSIKEILGDVKVKAIEELDDRHFEITHNPADELRILSIMRLNGLNRNGYENGVTLIRTY